MDWRVKIRKGAAADELAAEACGQGVGAWRADVMVKMTAREWEGHEWVRKKYGTEMMSNYGCRECVKWVWKPGGRQVWM